QHGCRSNPPPEDSLLRPTVATSAAEHAPILSPKSDSRCRPTIHLEGCSSTPIDCPSTSSRCIRSARRDIWCEPWTEAEPHPLDGECHESSPSWRDLNQ